ncbi:intracellular proteinase inhibitor BsuPI [Halanaerobium saccharolyticum]|uniref:Intracellular proteinase inhibitor BsuPI n=1 Tax=Halanaerobium saccharolyticum TaxID=43595 RepID=A0A4R7Z8R0_9FIRM|nr:BsuPI-related putative proteinase inhibitor [Halanaerobium saccharolyticum]RAK09833.1 intracellular proteinase inhibitor BsuPI [Halanaerobium saccharolyticum]TDW07395.1 intracellular proteinase inhibitor BsuPI [Halanaerobium saccharolyticum]TDX61274.1 intracellular proteinase inhibitor BsuPI [Halanaerobium saccharolyticum]
MEANIINQRNDVIIKNEENETVKFWSDNKGFYQVLGHLELKPGETKEYNGKSDVSLAEGKYTVSGIITTKEQIRTNEINIQIKK